MSTFHYSIVRYVPDVIRDEGINVGVVLQEDGERKTARCLFTETYQRVARLDPHFKSRTLEKILKGSVRQIAEEVRASELALADLVAHYVGGRVQLTEPRITIADDAQTELEHLYSQFVFEERGGRVHGKSDSTLKREVKEAFTEHGITRKYLTYGTQNNPLYVRGKRTRHEFDMGIKVNGYLDLFRCISFDVDDHEAKVRDAKVLIFDSRDIRETSTEAEIISILQPPERNLVKAKREAYGEARTILEDEEGITAYDFASDKDREQLLRMVQRRVNHHE